MSAKLLDTFWIMRTEKGWYPIQPSSMCRPEDHSRLNPHVIKIEDANGVTLWFRDLEKTAVQ